MATSRAARRRPPGSPFKDAVAAPVEVFEVGDRVTHDRCGLGRRRGSGAVRSGSEELDQFRGDDLRGHHDDSMVLALQRSVLCTGDDRGQDQSERGAHGTVS